MQIQVSTCVQLQKSDVCQYHQSLLATSNTLCDWKSSSCPNGTSMQTRQVLVLGHMAGRAVSYIQ